MIKIIVVIVTLVCMILVGKLIYNQKVKHDAIKRANAIEDAKKQADLRILTDLRTRVNLLDSDFRLHKIDKFEYNRGLCEVVELLDKFENKVVE